MDNPQIARNPFVDDSPTKRHNMKKEPQDLIGIRDIDQDIQSQDSTQNEFVSLDINQLQKYQTSGKIEPELNESNMTTKQQELKQPDLKDKQVKSQENTENTTARQGEDGSINKNPNWPHPKWAAYLYHDIESDIPKEMRFLVETGYRTWKLTTVGYIVNLMAIGFAAFHDNYYESGLAKSQSVFTSLLWLVVITPIGFLSWYMNLYRISQKFSTKNWLVFSVTFACHFLFAIIMLSGCPWYPCGGIFFIITCIFSRYILTTIFAAINCVIWTLVIILSMAIFTNVRQMVSKNDTTNEVKGDFKNTLAKVLSFAM